MIDCVLVGGKIEAFLGFGMLDLLGVDFGKGPGYHRRTE